MNIFKKTIIGAILGLFLSFSVLPLNVKAEETKQKEEEKEETKENEKEPQLWDIVYDENGDSWYYYPEKYLSQNMIKGYSGGGDIVDFEEIPNNSIWSYSGTFPSWTTITYLNGYHFLSTSSKSNSFTAYYNGSTRNFDYLGIARRYYYGSNYYGAIWLRLSGTTSDIFIYRGDIGFGTEIRDNTFTNLGTLNYYYYSSNNISNATQYYNGDTPYNDIISFVNTFFTISSPFTYSYNSNGATSGNVPASSTAMGGTTITLPGNTGSLARTGYTWVGWNTSSTATTALTTYTINANTTFYAIWQPNTYTMILNGNGAQFYITSSHTYENAISGLATTGSFYNDMQTTLNRATITRTGYTLLGWNTSSTATTALTAQQINSLVGNTTLYAIWQENIYTLTLNGNGTQFLIISSQTYENSISGIAHDGNFYNDMQTLLNRATITKTGYTLLGWNTSSTATTALTQTQINNLTGNTTLYAVWQENIVYYTIYFNANGATSGSVPQAVSVQNGTTYTLPGNTGSLARTGYTWVGWGATQIDTTPITSEMITSGRTYYAIWQPLPATTYTITFNSNGATSGNVPASITEPDGTTITLPGNTGGLVKNGYMFIGWNTASDANAGRENYTLNGSNVVMYAVWSATTIIYTVVFDPLNADGGNAPSSLNVEAGTTITLPGNTGGLTREGYTFIGWNTNPQLDTTITTYQVNGNTTFYPIWSQDPEIHYSISITLNDELLANFRTTNISDHYMFSFVGFDSQLFSMKLNGLRNLSAIISDPAYIISFNSSDIQFSFAGSYINTLLVYTRLNANENYELLYDWTETDIRENAGQWQHLWGGGDIVINIVSDENLTSPINSFKTITRTTFGAMQELFDLQFGWISIGGIIAIVLSISVMFFIFKIIRGGGNS